MKKTRGEIQQEKSRKNELPARAPMRCACATSVGRSDSAHVSSHAARGMGLCVRLVARKWDPSTRVTSRADRQALHTVCTPSSQQACGDRPALLGPTHSKLA